MMLYQNCILAIQMPINVSGSTSGNMEKIDSSLFVQKPYLRSNYNESNFENDTDLKN